MSSSERTLWLAVLQTYLVDAAKAKKIVHPERQRQEWDKIWTQATSEYTVSICDLLGLDHPSFVRRVEKAYRTGFFQAVKLGEESDVSENETVEDTHDEQETA